RHCRQRGHHAVREPGTPADVEIRSLAPVTWTAKEVPESRLDVGIARDGLRDASPRPVGPDDRLSVATSKPAVLRREDHLEREVPADGGFRELVLAVHVMARTGGEEQQVLAGGAVTGPLGDEAQEGRNADASGEHDDRTRAVARQGKPARADHLNREGFTF